MLYLFGLALASGLAVGIAALGGGLGQGRATAAALEAVARQPEVANRLLTFLVLGLALIESLTIYALVVSFELVHLLPKTADILKLLGR
ncbi:MAG: ATP synthase F0 subunit C [Armatimonadota bacterium]|jgi:F-type H+-transporting ATPase subunit c